MIRNDAQRRAMFAKIGSMNLGNYMYGYDREKIHRLSKRDDGSYKKILRSFHLNDAEIRQMKKQADKLGLDDMFSHVRYKSGVKKK